MSYEAYDLIFFLASVLSGIMLLAFIVLFIIFNVPGIISELSGKAAKKAIRQIQQKSTLSGSTEKGKKFTSEISTDPASPAFSGESTSPSGIMSLSSETEVLDEYHNKTRPAERSRCVIINELTYIHTNEVIE